MNIIAGKILRFVVNFVFFAVIMIAVVYYSYMNPPELLGVKNILLPMQAAVFLAFLLSLIMAGINEIITIFIIRITRRGKQ